MRTPNVALIHETVSLCFDQVLSTMGEITKRVTYDFLARKGIPREDLLSRFGDVEALLVQLYGQGGRSVMIGTLAKLCEEYSIPLNLTYSDSLSNRMAQLTENILMQKLVPKHSGGMLIQQCLKTKQVRMPAGATRTSLLKIPT